jgi:TRAP-type uncharacterized transport system substrate-binding protein
MRPSLKERFQRVLGLPQRHFARPTALKLAVLGGVLVLLGLLALFADRSPNLAHLRVSVLSASERGNYYAIVNALAVEARQRKGRITNVASTGSVENLARLVASQTACDVHFALVQDGIPWPTGSSLELISRLSKAESLVFLGRDADRITSLQDLHGMRIGIGPIGSGTEYVVRQVLAPLAALDLTLSTQRLDEQLVQLERGELDLGAMVIDEDAQRLVEAVRDRQLQLLNLPHADVLARRLPFARVGRIRAGQYDPVRLFPGEDKDVLQIDTLIIGNRCARWSVTQAFLTVLATVFPDFVRHNRDTPNRTGYPLAPAAHSYFTSEGSDIVGVLCPGSWISCRRRAGSSSSSGTRSSTTPWRGGTVSGYGVLTPSGSVSRVLCYTCLVRGARWARSPRCRRATSTTRRRCGRNWTPSWSSLLRSQSAVGSDARTHGPGDGLPLPGGPHG